MLVAAASLVLPEAASLGQALHLLVLQALQKPHCEQEEGHSMARMPQGACVLPLGPLLSL